LFVIYVIGILSVNINLTIFFVLGKFLQANIFLHIY
jgi:hypothetical protein